MYPRYFKRLPANWIESKSQRIVFEFIHKATNPISSVPTKENDDLVFGKEGKCSLSVEINRLRKRNKFRAGQTRITEEEGGHRMSRGGCCLRYINFRFVIVPPDSLRFAIQRMGCTRGCLFYLYNKFAQ